MKVFVNGIQRVGTNYTRQLLETNTDYSIHEYMPPYWKHDAYNDDNNPECDSIVCVIKNPYTWVESLCFRNCVDMIQKNPHVYNEFDHLGPFKINLIEACKLYKTFYVSWISYGVNLVHYEDMLDESYIKSFLNEKYNLVKDNINVPYDVNFSVNFKQEQKQTYKEYQLFHLNEFHIKTINEVLGKEFLQLIGYPIK